MGAEKVDIASVIYVTLFCPTIQFTMAEEVYRCEKVTLPPHILSSSPLWYRNKKHSQFETKKDIDPIAGRAT